MSSENAVRFLGKLFRSKRYILDLNFGYTGIEFAIYKLFHIFKPIQLFQDYFFIAEEAKYYLLKYGDLATDLFGGDSMERTERLYFTGTDYTINIIPIALVSAAVLGCEY
jgi:hypothetical protein